MTCHVGWTAIEPQADEPGNYHIEVVISGFRVEALDNLVARIERRCAPLLLSAISPSQRELLFEADASVVSRPRLQRQVAIEAAITNIITPCGVRFRFTKIG